MDIINSIFNFRVVADYAETFAAGIWATLWISALCLGLSLFLGVFLAGMRMARRGWLWRPAAAYIQFIRATPLLIQIYLVYYGLPQLLGASSTAVLTETVSGIVALTLHTTPYMAEIIRAGIGSVEKGQWDAASALGMRPVQRMVLVVLPQAFANVAPSLLGQTAVLIKDTSLLSIIAVFELMGAGLFVMYENVMPNEGLLTVAACYLAIYAGMLVISNRVQSRLKGGAYRPV
jgi:polar amino acid transport system permease protein